MSELVRLSFSIEKPLLERFERIRRASRYTNRSEFVRDMLRDRLVEQQWEGDEEVLGTVTLVYNHHFRRLSEKLTDLQHGFHSVVLATTHVHLDKRMCAEMILCRGRPKEIRQIADLLRQQKGVLHAVLSMSSTGKHLG
ncbi:MAG: nickel-responsive transcriptional regulator NikR [Planctomycetes bacterium]|nr:nickel-responsive transcriptional regulator NikR [Planctomycetota bacterium]